MNKKDWILIVVLLVLSGIGIVLLPSNKKGTTARVYYQNKLVLSIDLTNPSPRNYTVEGKNGEVHIFTENGKVKVIEENSPKHLCSKQGFIASAYEEIVCLPNEVVIKIEDDTLDGVIY